MSADTLVFDMSSQSEGSPSVFVRKDWLSILDNQNQNYQGNQSVVDTSQLANSNKYMNYREAYLTVPLVLTLTGGATTGTDYFLPASPAASCDFALGLKNWYGSIVHSFTLDYNGTTIIQQTPFIGMWNTFKLNNTLSFNDLVSSSSQLGFYPDSPLAWSFTSGNSQSGLGCCNNANGAVPVVVFGALNSQEGFNNGLLQRQLAWNFDPDGKTGLETNATAYTSLLATSSLSQLWKSYIYTKQSQTSVSLTGAFQVAITAQIYLKHLASFFERVPLLKGVFMKMTLNLNQSSVSFSTATTATVATTATSTISTLGVFTPVTISTGSITASVGQVVITGGVTYTIGEALSASTFQVSPFPTATVTSFTGAIYNAGLVPATIFSSVVPVSPLGGVQPIMIASAIVPGSNGAPSGGAHAFQAGTAGAFIVSLAVGNKVINASQATATGVAGSPLGGSIILNVPAYSFNPVFEGSYLSSPIKKVVYTDVYQYQITNTIKSGQNFNNLISNGIANIKSVLCLPFYTNTGSGGTAITPILSPFDPAGSGTTSPLCLFNQFNIQISGQNAIYNTERYAYEQYLNQLYGQLAVNGGLTDGMTSGLIDQKAFESCYNYYYVNCGRMLPVEEAVPKSVSVLGLSMNVNAIDLFVFVEYGVEVAVDVLTGARV